MDNSNQGSNKRRRKLAKILKYGLEIKVPKQDKQLVDVLENFSLGSGSNADVVLDAEGVSPLHLKFKLEDEVLTMTNLGGSGKTKVGRHELGQGKTYIVDKGDKITIGKVTIVIKTEKVDEEEFLKKKSGPSSIDSEEEETEVEEQVEIEEESETEESEEEEEQVEEEAEDGDIVEANDVAFEQEQEPEKTSTLVRIRRILQNRNKSSGPQSSQKLKKAKATYPPIPGFFIRTLSILINLIIIFGLYFYVLPDFKLDQYITPYINMVLDKKDWLINFIPSPYIEQIPPIVISTIFSPTNLLVLALYLGLDLISHLLFGTSLALFLAGVTDHSNIFVSRIKAIFRFVLSIITTPLIIFDLPLIFRKRSLKEVLTFTHLKYRSGFLRFMAVVLFYPLIVILVFGYPLIPAIDSLIIERQMIEQPLHKRAVADPEGEDVRTIINKSLSFKSVVELPPKLMIIPSISQLKPRIVFYDIEEKALVEFGYNASVDFNPLIKVLPAQDFYFSKSSPLLYKFLTNQEAQDGFETEIDSILRDSLALNFQNIHQFVLNHGPFFGPYLPIREKMLSVMENSVEFLTFTRLRQACIRAELSTGNNRRYIYMPMTGLINDTYLMTFNSKSKKLGNKWMSIYEHSNPVKPSMVPDFKDVVEWNGFVILDLLSSMFELDKPLYPKISLQTYNYFFQIAKKLYKEEDKLIERKVAAAFKDVDLAIKEAISKRPRDEKVLTEFNYSMNRLQKAFEEKDESFFSMNAP